MSRTTSSIYVALPFAARLTVLPHLSLTKPPSGSAALQMRKLKLAVVKYFVRVCSAGRADVHTDFPLHATRCLIREQAFWVCPCLLLVRPGEGECCAVPPGLAVGTLLWMVTVLLCSLSWDV